MSPPPIMSHCLSAFSVVLGLPFLASHQHDDSGLHGRHRRQATLTLADGGSDCLEEDKHSAISIVPAFSPSSPTATTAAASVTSSATSAATLPIRGKENIAATTSSMSSRRNHNERLFARRVQGNISRIYARRIIDKARLERQHPWWRKNGGKEEAASSSSSGSSSSSSDVGSTSTETTTFASSSHPTNSTSSSWRNTLLSETLLSLLKLKEKMENVQSFAFLRTTNDAGNNSNYYSNTNNINGNNWLLDLMDQPQQNQSASSAMSMIMLMGSTSSRVAVAQCEESSSNNAKQRTLDKYNELHDSSSSTVMANSSSTGFWGRRSRRSNASSEKNNKKEKPAEWNEDIDLVQKRHEFGQQISPLSHTTRLQRWGMALQRIATLSMLVAPLGILVPLNYVVGNVVAAGCGSCGDTTASISSAMNREEGGNGQGGGTITITTTTTTTMDGNLGGIITMKTPPKVSSSALQKYHTRLSTLTWDYALWAIETAGPTYIKLVQWASTRHDLFSPEFVSHFTKLQDETRGHSWKETEMTLVRSFGKDWKNVLSFDKVIDDGISMDEGEDGVLVGDGIEGGRLKRTGGAANRERQKRLFSSTSATTTSSSSSSSSVPTIPIGSGCVAQVYKARLTTHHGLHPPGTSVAVKVQHPRILEKVCLDFYILNKVASFLEYIPYLNLDYLSMKDSVDQFRDIMLPQLDLRVEAHNLQRFRRDFDGATQIAFPEPFLGLTTREVLVERFVEGEPMLNFVLKEDKHHSKKDRQELATIGLETVMKMIFLHDFVHADLHPGNMIVDRNKNARGNPLRVHMIDCGLTVELGERDHKNLVKILGSLIKRDGYAAGALMVDTAKKCQATELDVELFCKGIEKICLDDEDNNFLESVGDYITDICYLACKHKVKLEAAFINAALACEIMEGLASSLYPDMQVQTVALPMVLKAEMMHGLKGLPSPRLWSLK